MQKAMWNIPSLLLYGGFGIMSLAFLAATPNTNQQPTASTSAPNHIETQSVSMAYATATLPANVITGAAAIPAATTVAPVTTKEIPEAHTSTDTATSPFSGPYPVTRVIDGDTIEVLIENEKRTIRYIGIDTPETVHPSKPVECFGVEASARNKALVAGTDVYLEKDVTDTDKYGRLLRYVYAGDVFVNHTLVAEGYAHVYTYPPDVRHDELFLRAQQEARASHKGLWGDICKDTEKTTNTPTSVRSIPKKDTSTGCTIKGNISTKNDEKIYHVVGCGSYNKTVIDESKGERWFCTEQEAQDAGWRKAKNC
jgi:micrococcal nuclease